MKAPEALADTAEKWWLRKLKAPVQAAIMVLVVFGSLGGAMSALHAIFQCLPSAKLHIPANTPASGADRYNLHLYK